MSPFLRKVKTASGAVAVQIVEKKHGQRRIVEHLGSAHSEAESKSDLTARPIFHHTREAIEAHPTIVFAALAIARDLQARSGQSLKKIITSLRPLRQVTININGHRLHSNPPSTPRPTKH